MTATLIVRHTVADHAAWRAVYDEVDELRSSHGCTGEHVLHAPGDLNDIVALHNFPTVEQAQDFADDPGLKDAMGRAGVTSAPRIEIFESA
jgi:hypothetical protein